jgi:hypothetical protein
MTHRTLAALGLLALGVGPVLSPAARAEPAKYFPASTAIVVTVNVRQIRESDLAKEKKEAVDLLKVMLEGALQQNEEAAKYIKQLSFDPFQDLDGITAVGEASADPAKVLVLVTGRFDVRKFAATAAKAVRDHGDILKLSRVGKQPVVEVAPPGQDKTFYVALVDAKTLLISEGKATLEAALARAAAAKPAALKQEVKDFLGRDYNKKASLTSLAMREALGELLAASNDPNVVRASAALQGLLLKVVSVSVNVTLGNDVEFQLRVKAKNADTAKEFAVQANFLLLLLPGAVARKVQQDKALAPALDVVKTLRASAQGNTFILRGHVPAAVLGQALKEALNRYPLSR